LARLSAYIAVGIDVYEHASYNFEVGAAICIQMERRGLTGNQAMKYNETGWVSA